MDKTRFSPKIWGPHYWFTLFTIALCYPISPTAVTKKKYYEFIHNLPLFLPIPEYGNTFSSLIDKYPVSPYLDSRESFIQWVHFIHNRVNELSHPPVPPISLEDALYNYHKQYTVDDNYSTSGFSYKLSITWLIIISLLVLIFYNANSIRQ